MKVKKWVIFSRTTSVQIEINLINPKVWFIGTQNKSRWYGGGGGGGGGGRDVMLILGQKWKYPFFETDTL